MSDANKSGVSAVMRRIQTYIADKNYKPTFISVAGDNYYPNKLKNKDKKEKENTEVKSKEKSENKSKDKTAKKEKPEVKQKIIVESELVSGFECLKSLNVPVKVILGNHDLETNRENKHSFFIHPDTEADTCQIIKLEKEITKPSKPGVELKLDFLTKDDIPFIGTNTMVLMIDTSMYETDDADIAQYEECYEQITDQSQEISELQKHQKSRVLEAIKLSNKTNIVVIGHHPITGYIIKKDTRKLVEPFPAFVELWQAIIAEAARKTLYYLCADKHFYQPGTVTIDDTPIHQYIVGTGGAELDANPFKHTFTDGYPDINKMATETMPNVTYSMTSRQILDSYSNYGFLTCTETSNRKLVFQFISIHFKHSLNLSAKSAKKFQYAERRNRQIRMTQSVSPFRRRSPGLSRSRAASLGGKKPRTRKLYRRKQK